MANAQTERLTRLIEKFPRVTVTVVGDMVADEFLIGEISRVSREAPVLILKHRERQLLPGGGANAVYNLATLGVRVLPVGVVGDDEPGRLLLERFRERRIPTAGIRRLKGHTTVTKTRILAGMAHSGRQQVVRIDREPAPLGWLPEIVSRARAYARASDALLFSDYGYGAAAPEIVAAVRRGAVNGVPITLDSRYRLLEYQGVTAATPNEPEIEEALRTKIGNNTRSLFRAADRIMKKMRLKSLVITRGRDGMVAFDRGRKPVNIPIYGTDQVADVTGAGDTVIATFTAALAAGGDTEAAARLANYAGGIVVMKRGTATVSRDELLKAVQGS